VPGHLLPKNCLEDEVTRHQPGHARAAAFLLFGIGTEAAAVCGLLFMFRRRGWL
jgi:hypothetical protein